MHVIRSEPLPLVVLEPPESALLQAYYLENRGHLAPWEPARDEAYYSVASMRNLVAERHRQFLDKTALHLCAIDDGRMVAECNFTNIVRGPFQACNLGFSVAKSKEGRGFMTTVVRQGTEIMFSQYGLHRIEANYMPRNARSPRVLERCGFVRERPIAGPVPRIRSVPAPPPAQGHTDLPWNRRRRSLRSLWRLFHGRASPRPISRSTASGKTTS